MYCGQIFPAEELTVDHVQPRVRGGDRSGGNLVTACRGCNTLKGHRSVASFLLDDAARRTNFFRFATAVWERHLRAVRESIERSMRARRGRG
ncbi:MAG TPA: HNH endonuclease [Gemmatimonadaceae bacterium]